MTYPKFTCMKFKGNTANEIRAIQEELFKLGYMWAGSLKDQVVRTHSKDFGAESKIDDNISFIFTNDSGYLSYLTHSQPEFFYEDTSPEFEFRAVLTLCRVEPELINIDGVDYDLNYIRNLIGRKE